jgi:hypothetical protein
MPTAKVLKSLLSIILVMAHTDHVMAGQPSVLVVYSPSLDSACSLVRGGVIKEEWKEELAARKGEFENLWTNIGPKLIEATESITGKPFPAEPITARLTLCNLPSQAIIGVSVNMRYVLESFVSPPLPMRYKVDTLFHELLHVFISSHPVLGSTLLTEHASESACTRNHLHLFALQKAVLLRLQEHETLQQVITIDGQLPDACYKRAWALLNESDSAYLKYVAELAR